MVQYSSFLNVTYFAYKTLVANAPFTLINKATGFCLVKKLTRCLDLRWTTGDRLFTSSTKKCLGAQGKTVGSEVSLYDCDDRSDLQKWECKNETLLALKGSQLYIEVKADESIALSRAITANNELTITGTSSGACTRTYRELYTIQGNAFGKICMFPFLYKDRWFGDCTTFDSSVKRLWCAIGTKYEHEQWGYCPTSSTEHWAKNIVTGAYYQINSQSSLTWAQADASCKQQAASLVSITDPNQQGFMSALLASGKFKLWIGLVLDPEHNWQWTNGKPFRYLRWSTGNPLPNPGHNCAFLDSIGQQSWQSSSCGKKMGYICYKDGAPPTPPQIEQGFCPSPWIPYNGHCFHLRRDLKTWSDAQIECRKEGGDLVSIRNAEDQGFVISQLGYASTDELWIGLNDIRTEGLFDWSDHSFVSFTSWAYGKPSLSADAVDCILIMGENGNWADRLCDEKHGFICMKQSETERPVEEVDVDAGCNAGWKKHGSYCYFVGTQTKTFAEAKDWLVDNAFLVSLVGMRPERHFWLGLSNQKNIHEFEWTSGKSVRYTHWNTGMPGNVQGCVAMTTGIFAGLWDVLPCTNSSKYICKHLAKGAVLTPEPPTQSPPQCPEGWIKVGTRNLCSKFFTGPRANEKTWFEARDYCRAIGGDLLSIHNSADLFVGRYGKAWIGLRAPDPTTGYVWSDGSPFNFQNWQEGEPNNHNNDESCVEFRLSSGSWNDVNCESYNDWICQIRAGMTPHPPPNNTAVGILLASTGKYVAVSKTISDYNTTSDGWLEWRGKQYYINRNSLPMEDARHFCQQRHGDLVSIMSKEENTFLWKQISRTYGSYYIGMSVDLDGTSWWMDNSLIGLQRWEENQPSSESYDKNCVVMTYYMAFLITTLAETAAGDTWIGLNSLKENGFYWTDGKPRRYTYWGYSEDCVVMTSNSAIGLGKWLVKSCNDTNGYICHRNVEPTLKPPPDPTIPNIYVSLGNDSVKVVTKNLTWEAAKKQCEGEKATLASLRNDWTLAYVELLTMNLNAPVWIGLNKQQTQGYFKYIDNWHLSTTNWAEDEPSRGKPCVYVDVDGKWRTAYCNETMNSVCMQSTDVPPTQSTVFPGVCPEETSVEYRPSYTWVPFKGHCYLFVTEEIEWADAASSCVRHGGILASIGDPEEQQFINYNIKTFKDSHTSFWIGLFKTHTGTWKWLDKSVMEYTNWTLDEPQYDFGEIGSEDGAWKTGRRWHDRAYICETPKVMPGVSDPNSEYNKDDGSPSRVHTSLVVVLVITAVSMVIVAGFFLYKNSPVPLPTFDNPLYFDSERSQPDVVDTNKLIENAEVENPEPIITL
ncbi:Macrophage mannose receptor 1 [Collichthys lucidus]|uniref:Macrophage mannose receptor 1 n=1 Tax=Collichthys lucidus TaxID=240159 RepID=A0A4U5UWF8_COLLU|nr:Macrophage mannose receptor 1 [Collichthys lucidus]